MSIEPDADDEQDFADFFVLYAADIAEELGIERQPDGSWSEADVATLTAECRKRFPVTDPS